MAEAPGPVRTDRRQFSERTKELWFQIDDLSQALHKAERRRNRAEVAHHIQGLLPCIVALQAEVQEIRFQRNRN